MQSDDAVVPYIERSFTYKQLLVHFFFNTMPSDDALPFAPSVLCNMCFWGCIFIRLVYHMYMYKYIYMYQLHGATPSHWCTLDRGVHTFGMLVSIHVEVSQVPRVQVQDKPTVQ